MKLRHTRASKQNVNYSYESFLQELGTKLRQMRVERGWTLRDMIVLHGFHLAHWQGFEKGRGMSIQSLLRICAVFSMRLEDLIAGVGLVDAGPILPALSCR